MAAGVGGAGGLLEQLVVLVVPFLLATSFRLALWLVRPVLALFVAVCLFRATFAYLGRQTPFCFAGRLLLCSPFLWAIGNLVFFNCRVACRAR